MTTETTNNGRQLQNLEARLQDCEKRLENLDSACGFYASKEVLTLEEASLFLGLSKSQLYKLTGAGAIPHYKPGGKYIYFDRADLVEWVRHNPIKSRKQHELDAIGYVSRKPIKR